MRRTRGPTTTSRRIQRSPSTFPRPPCGPPSRCSPTRRGARRSRPPSLPRTRFAADKFAEARLSPVPSDLVTPPRVKECALQFETRVRRITPGVGDYAIVEAEVVRVHALPEIVKPGTQHIDPRQWQPTIYAFRHYFGLGAEVGHRPTSDTHGELAI
ncbi:flavin reductase family protein [Demequina litorisediminis]|uniref:flavin reductase family protein n=1 Tax=Demequina litorisediminis TaxID=1849022 RepID=UPI003D664C8B